VSDKQPQPTPVLVKRLRRLARALDKEKTAFHTPENKARFTAWANTCWQSAARLAELDAPRAGYEDFARTEKGRFKSKPEEYGPRDRAILGGDPSL
jgi:hypothetical protein